LVERLGIATFVAGASCNAGRFFRISTFARGVVVKFGDRKANVSGESLMKEVQA